MSLQFTHFLSIATMF